MIQVENSSTINIGIIMHISLTEGRCQTQNRVAKPRECRQSNEIISSVTVIYNESHWTELVKLLLVYLRVPVTT